MKSRNTWIALAMVCAAAGWGACILLGWSQLELRWAIVSSAVGGILYLSMARVFMHETFNEVVERMRRIIGRRWPSKREVKRA